ncbi:MAG: Acetamidase [Pycnora praestabilis]|nr:MAG: Acetamidase [Pycnora praestabilis]
MAVGEGWQVHAKAKRDSVNSLVPEKWRLAHVPTAAEQRDVTGDYICQFLSANEVKITETDAVGIVEKTTAGEWSAFEVAEAFCHRAALAHQLVRKDNSTSTLMDFVPPFATNCLHEIFFDAALDDAKALDQYYAEHSKPLGPLHGLPVSLKDQFHVRGVETTMGYVGWIGTFQGQKGTGREKVYESEMVRELRALGAILYCKTSVPHTLMSGETVNNIIGYCWNPKNRNLSCGGSSGGEGALIGLKGSPVGFGTDIGGSIRIPAGFNGLYGIRPSAGRLPYEGMANSMDGQNSILSVVGPLAQTVRGLRLVVKSLLSQSPWLHDPLVHEMPWRDEHEKMIMDFIGPQHGGAGKLSFGVMKHDGIVAPHPPVRRAIETVVQVLEKLGHKVIEWMPPSHERGNNIGMTTWFYDGGADVHKAFALSGEPVAMQVSGAYGDKPFEQMNASKIAETNILKREFQKDYMDYWNSTKEITGTGRSVDAVIAPIAPFAAALPEKYSYYGYSTFVNVLDYTSCVIPVTTADKAIDIVDEGYKPINEQDQKIYEHYDPGIFDGAHVAVQLVGRRLQEEKVLALAELVGEAIDKN